MDLQIILNSCIFVFIAVRYAEYLMEAANTKAFIGFMLAVFSANVVLLMGRFEVGTALYKAAMIAAGFFVGVVVLSWNNKRHREKKERAQNSAIDVSACDCAGDGVGPPRQPGPHHRSPRPLRRAEPRHQPQVADRLRPAGGPASAAIAARSARPR